MIRTLEETQARLDTYASALCDVRRPKDNIRVLYMACVDELGVTPTYHMLETLPGKPYIEIHRDVVQLLSLYADALFVAGYEAQYRPDDQAFIIVEINTKATYAEVSTKEKVQEVIAHIIDVYNRSLQEDYYD